MMKEQIKREHAVLAIILVTAFVIRLYGVIVDVDFFFREATYGMAAWRVAEGDLPYRDFYHSQTPLSPLLLASVFLIFGVGIVQARLFLVFFTTFSCFLIFLSGKRIDYKTGLLGSLVFAIFPITVHYGMVAVNDFIAITFCAVGYYFLTPILTHKKDEKRDLNAERYNLILAGLFASVGVMIKMVVVPIYLAFIVIIIIEGQFAGFEINDQVKNLVFLVIGFIIPLLLILLPFYLVIGDEFINQVLGQHLAKSLWKTRWSRFTNSLILANLYFFVFFILSAPFAARKPYGRGLLICILVMVFVVFFLVPGQGSNYYHVNALWMSMVCGFFPISNFKSLNLKQAILVFLVIANLLLYKIYRYLNLGIARIMYFNHALGIIAITLSMFSLIALFVLIIKERQFTGVNLNVNEIRNFFLPHQIFNRIRAILSQNSTKIVLVSAFLILIATTNVSYPPLAGRDKQVIDWIKTNTSPNEYIIVDDLKINFRAKRRSPFAEISKDRTDLGELTGEMFIEACYDFDVRVIVNAGRMFDYRDTYIVFLDFLEANYAKIEVGHTIYVRTSPLQ